MDYFGVTEMSEVDFSKENLIPFSQDNCAEAPSFPKDKCGFGCATPGCENKEYNSGTYILPHCDKNIVCMQSNIQYLSLENARLKGEIGGMEFILSKLSDFGTQLKNSSVSSMDNSL